MQPKRFTGKIAAQVLRDVRVTLGPDAVILVNRQVEEQIEIYAMAAEDMARLSTKNTPLAPPADQVTCPVLFPVLSKNNERAQPVATGEPTGMAPTPVEPTILVQDPQLLPVLSQQATADPLPGNVLASDPLLGSQALPVAVRPTVAEPVEKPTDPLVDLLSHGMPSPHNRSPSSMQELLQHYYHDPHPAYEPAEQKGTAHPPEPSPPVWTAPLASKTRLSHPEPGSHPLMEKMMRELASMRQLLEKQVLETQETSAARAQSSFSAIREATSSLLLQCGFSTQFCRELVDTVPENLPRDKIFYWLHRKIDQQLIVADYDMIDEGGIIAFVGPTGVGKTTSVAKFAARFVMRHGASSIALVTTDHYRVAAYEQLRVYADILGVPIFAARSAAELAACLRELSDKKAIVIDTMGVSQRDNAVNDILAMFNTPSCTVKRYLVLSATATRDNLEEVVRAYQPQLACALSGCIITKVDEAVRLGSIIDVVINHHLKLMYFADGQSVPEDFHCPDRQYLLSRTLSPSAATKANVFAHMFSTQMVSGTKPALNETQKERVLL